MDLFWDLSFSLSHAIHLLFPPHIFFQVEFIKEMIKQAGVVAVPGCGFFHTIQPSDKSPPADLSYQKRYIRFAFCKSDATLAAAAQKIGGLLDARGRLRLL